MALDKQKSKAYHRSMKSTEVPYQERPDYEKIEKLLKLYRTGSYTQTSLAKMWKITRQRVNQIIKQYGKEVKTNDSGSKGDRPRD